MSRPSVTEITSKQGMSQFARAHEGVPGINWTTQAGPGGTLIITEHEATVTPGIRDRARTAVAA